MKNEITIELFKGKDLSELVNVVTNAMLTNPLHVAVFRSADDRASGMQRKMFDIVLRQPSCTLYIAKRNNDWRNELLYAGSLSTFIGKNPTALT